MKKPENQAINGRLVFFEQAMVGKTGFEPATPWSQTRCATGLRYFPNGGKWMGAANSAQS